MIILSIQHPHTQIYKQKKNDSSQQRAEYDDLDT